jgi:hypothetical protein
VDNIVKKENLRSADQTTVISKNGSKQPVQKNRSKSTHIQSSESDESGVAVSPVVKPNAAATTTVASVMETKKPYSESERELLDHINKVNGKTLRKETLALKKRVEKCDISEALQRYSSVCSTIESLENTIAACTDLTPPIPTDGITKMTNAFRAEEQKLFAQITEVLRFGNTIFPQVISDLKKHACSSEEKSLLVSIEKQFDEMRSQTQSDMDALRNAPYKVLTTVPTITTAWKLVEKLEVTATAQNQAADYEEADSFSEIAVADAGDNDNDDF